MENTATQDSDKAAQAKARVLQRLGAHLGKPVFIRIFKEERLLELWLQAATGEWNCFSTYAIAGMSGELGPKTQEGDKQVPEGFYKVTPRGMNPHSKYHLSFNIGYPNLYDIAQGRTGSYIMIHGGTSSQGCFAMTDEKIEEIYTLVNEAFACGSESVPVQIYPFRMTEQRLQSERNSPHCAFWQHLMPGYIYTETHKAPFPYTDSYC